MTVASNLPQGNAGGGGSSSTNKNSTETVSYEINETRTEVETLPGEIQRISIAVLLNEQALGIDPAAADAGGITSDMEIQQLRADDAFRLNASRWPAEDNNHGKRAHSV